MLQDLLDSQTVFRYHNLVLQLLITGINREEVIDLFSFRWKDWNKIMPWPVIPQPYKCTSPHRCSAGNNGSLRQKIARKSVFIVVFLDFLSKRGSLFRFVHRIAIKFAMDIRIHLSDVDNDHGFAAFR